MELGVHFIDFLPGAPKLGPTLADAVKTAEDGGVAMFTLADHFFQMEAMGRVNMSASGSRTRRAGAVRDARGDDSDLPARSPGDAGVARTIY
jgi:alkanesulfonate monooxygenase SsuD/methylene tetrahydromethanopterin reductase-like flavin-dependent oxidoreductase (luciferase family)